MRRLLIATTVAVAVVAGLGRAPSADDHRWWSHVEALANDGMEGRNTGSPAHKRAADYVAAQFQKAGLEPSGDTASRSYIQPVSFNTRQIVEQRSSLAIVRNGNPEPLKLGEDANFSMRIDPAPSIDAPLVFVGYGLKVPELQIDDLGGRDGIDGVDGVDGVDVRGAVVVYIAATPKSLPGPLQAHFGSAAERWKTYRAAGAVGTLSLANPKSMDIPWSRSTLARLQPQMSLVDASLDDAAGQQFAVTMNPAHADKLFTGTGHTFQELLALVDAGKPLPRFALPLRVRATTAVERSQVVSQNVAGILRGWDPRRRDEYVVLSAHLDHLGVGEPIDGHRGDRIYNGAMDNASGVAAILEVATELHEMGLRPARSILFVAVTGEEKGELGSRYFAAHPPVPRRNIVANVNTDMFLPLFPLKTLMVLGLDESDLGQDVRAVAREIALNVQSDPEPQRNRFVRSDQYSFVKVGIPAVAMKVGYEPGSPEARIAAKWIAERYHAPSDDLNQPFDMAAGGKYVEVLRSLAVRIANRADAPSWNKTSFFKRFAAPTTE
ncbi:MAG TPA: M20/M25/M40 family metallo-hydrolase [Vicinamibacterales bacterium]|nr:M20/M25/M40 family metallo-hydrolase [Vicinamibacterales bacterium]